MNEDEFEHEFGDPLTHINEIDHLARLLLINAAEQPQYADLVQAAIVNSGKKQLILGGTEIVALSVLGIAALKIIFNPMASEEIEYTNKDGVKVKVKRVYNSDTGFINKIFAKLFNK